MIENIEIDDLIISNTVYERKQSYLYFMHINKTKYVNYNVIDKHIAIKIDVEKLKKIRNYIDGIIMEI